MVHPLSPQYMTSSSHYNALQSNTTPTSCDILGIASVFAYGHQSAADLGDGERSAQGKSASDHVVLRDQLGSADLLFLQLAIGGIKGTFAMTPLACHLVSTNNIPVRYFSLC